MPQDNLSILKNVLRCAKALLEARENDMVTSAEWDALRRAVAVAKASGTIDDDVHVDAQ